MLIIFVLAGFRCAHANDMLARLDSVLLLRGRLMEQKEREISLIKRRLETATSPRGLLKGYYELYGEYYVYQFDSAKVYVNKGLELARQTHDQYYIDLNTMLKAELLSMGSFYSEARDCMEKVDVGRLTGDMSFKYYHIYNEVYSYWGDYCRDGEYGPRYYALSTDYFRKAVGELAPTDDKIDYYKAEYYVRNEPDTAKAFMHYRRVLKYHPNSSRVYAMASFALACLLRSQGDMDGYERYLTESAIGDILNCTKENSALQSLAVYLFNKSPDNLVRAERYIKVSMEDAMFYNNRLRVLEVSHNLPAIFGAYQRTIDERNRSQKVALWLVSLSFLALVCSTVFIFRQNHLLSLRRRELTDGNSKLQELNSRLAVLNERLVDTNRRRENLAKLYIDLCARYIDRLSRTHTLVKRKIKANQVGDLLSMLSSSRLSEEDAATFLNHFDKAFLDLYPTFVDELNGLLSPDAAPLAMKNGRMSTELRIFALIRLGVKESSEIAALLFYSPQTIYNYRSSVKSRALNKESFEDDVAQLCTVIG